MGRFVRDVLRESLTRTVTAKVGALLSRQAFNEFRRRLDYREYGGAPLLGVRGICIICLLYTSSRVIKQSSVRYSIEAGRSAIGSAVTLRIDFGCLLSYRAVRLNGVGVEVIGPHADEVRAVDSAHLT